MNSGNEVIFQGNRKLMPVFYIKFKRIKVNLNPLDFFFCGFLDEKVFLKPVERREGAVACIKVAVTFIDENMLQRVRASMINRANVYIEVGGDLFEHLL